MKFCFVLFISVLISCVDSTAQQQLSQTKAERLYAKGRELVEHKNYGAARHVFAEYLAIAPYGDPRKSEAQYYEALSALRLGNEDGEKLIDDFIEQNPSSPRSSTAYYDLALFFYNGKNYTKAGQYFKKVDFPALTSEQQAEAHFSYGYALFSQKKLEEALEQFNFVKTAKNSYAPAASYYAGFVEYSKGSYEDAIVDLKRAEANASYASIVPYLIANTYYRQHKYDELIKYAESIKTRTDVANAKEFSMLVAEAYFFKGDYKLAATSYEDYLETYGEKADAPLLYRAGYSYYAMGQDDKAIKYLKKSAASTDSVSYYASYYLGIVYLKKGVKNLALNSFEYTKRYVKDLKLKEEGSFQYGKVAYDAGKPDLAIVELEKFLKEFPESAHDLEVKELLAQAYVNGNNFNKAIEYIEALPTRSSTMNKAYQKATYLKGSELFNKEEYPEAVAYFEKSLANPIDPVYVSLSSFWCAEAYSIGRKYEESISYYTKVIDAGASADAETLLKTRYGLGYAYFNTKVYDRALYNFKEYTNKADKKSFNYTDALIRLADCYYVTKAYQSALDTYAKARNMGSPDNDYILLQVGIINGILKNYTEARANLTSLVSSYQKSQYRDEALFQRAQFEIEQGNYPVAIEGLSQLIRETPTSPFIPFAYRRRAESYYNLKQYEKSSSDYAFIVNQFPTHQTAQQAIVPLQEALGLAGKSSEFDGYLEQVKKANPENKGFENVEYESAKNLYFDQQYQKAITRLNAFIASYPESAHANEANYYIAESYYRLKEYDKALGIFQNIGNDMSLNIGSKVTARIAEIQFKQNKYDAAIDSYHKLEKMATNKKDFYTAWSGIMESFYLLGKYDSVGTYANLIIERGNVNASAQNKASLFLGKAAMSKGDFVTAQDEFLNTLNTAQDEYGAEAKYLVAQMFYTQKEYKQCYETLVSLFNDFAAYESWVGKAYLLLADNFVAQQDVFNAKVTLESLIKNFPQQVIKDEARIKLAKIEADQAKKKEEIKADTLGQ